MRTTIAVVLVAVGLVVVTPPDTASASTGCVTRHEFNEVYNSEWPSRSRVRAIFGTPGQRIAYDPSGGLFFGGGGGDGGSELRAYRTCPPGGAVWVYFYHGHWTSPSAEWVRGILPDGTLSRSAMWWFN